MALNIRLTPGGLHLYENACLPHTNDDQRLVLSDHAQIWFILTALKSADPNGEEVFSNHDDTSYGWKVLVGPYGVTIVPNGTPIEDGFYTEESTYLKQALSLFDADLNEF
jgi:hypothetical protein